MSEQTPNSSEDLSGAEPSMEDILASIRKIISDDEPVAMESPEDVASVNLAETSAHDDLDDLMQGIHMDSNDLTSDAVLDAAVIQSDNAPASAESVDLNIDDVLAGLDEDILGFDPAEATAVESDMVIPEGTNSTVYDIVQKTAEPEPVAAPFSVESLMPTPDTIESDGIIPDVDEDILAFLDADIPLTDAVTPDVAELMPEFSAEAETAVRDVSPAEDLEMDALLDDILMSPMEIEGAPVDTGFSAEMPRVDESADLDLVKSLMADLADDPDSFETEEDLDALLAIPEVEEEPAVEELVVAEEQDVEAVEDQQPEPEEDILGDILNMTLEDELQNHPEDIQTDAVPTLDDISQAEQDNIAENLREIDDILAEDGPDDDLPSLSEIAAAAEADAVAVETIKAPQAVAATAGLASVAGIAALGATTLGAAPAETQTETAEIYAEPAPQTIREPIPTQETSMPVQAVKTDAILDDVTETAAAGAFAELNQVVEDKAIFNERGPRIGDLVQEALRPMLKDWLDANLKGIVERAVAKEVKRISSGK